MFPLVGQHQTWLAEWFCLRRNWIGPASQRRPASALYCLFSPCDEHRSSQLLSNLEKNHSQKVVTFTSQFPFDFCCERKILLYFFIITVTDVIVGFLVFLLQNIEKKKIVITSIWHILQYFLSYACYFGCEPCLICYSKLLKIFQFYVYKLNLIGIEIIVSFGWLKPASWVIGHSNRQHYMTMGK